MDPTLAQLWIAQRVIPAGRAGDHVADAGTRQSQLGSGTSGLAATDAEEPGPDECESAPGGFRHAGNDGDGHHTGDRSGGAESSRTGEVAKSWLPQERGGDRRTIKRTLAPGSSVQPGAKLADVRCHRRAD